MGSVESALRRAQRVSQEASAQGFDWPDVTGVLAKLDEERREIEQAMVAGGEGLAGELGDYLFALVNLCRFLEVDPEAALEGTTDRFELRFDALRAQLAAEGSTIDAHTTEALEARWQAAKRSLSS